MIDVIVNREALTLAVNDVFLLYAALFVVMIPIVWMARPPFGNVGPAAAH
jgi:MFS transporter, DHA2 family, multidrug resistance protein